MKPLARNITTLAVLCCSLTSIGVTAAEAVSRKHAETAIEYRQSLFQLLKSNMAPLGGMAKGALPYDASVMQTNSMRIEQLADMMTDYLKVDTRKFDVKTDAKDEIWENFSDVEKKIEALKTAAVNLQSVATSGSEDQYRAAIGDVGAACKSCHDDYKKD